VSDVVAALEGAERWIMEQRRSRTYGGEPIPELVAIQSAIPVAREQAERTKSLVIALESVWTHHGGSPGGCDTCARRCNEALKERSCDVRLA